MLRAGAYGWGVLVQDFRVDAQALFKRSVLTPKTKAKNKSEDEVGKFIPSDWSNRGTVRPLSLIHI